MSMFKPKNCYTAPYDYQERILENWKNHNESVLVGPRRIGKTSMAFTFALHEAERNRSTLILNPSDGSERCLSKSLIDVNAQQWIGSGCLYNNQVINFSNINEYDLIDAFAYDTIIFEEAAYMSNSKFMEFILQLKPSKKTISISTPSEFKGHFYDKYRDNTINVEHLNYHDYIPDMKVMALEAKSTTPYETWQIQYNARI